MRFQSETFFKFLLRNVDGTYAQSGVAIIPHALCSALAVLSLKLAERLRCQR